jgi:hypothetical protein
VVGSKVCLPSHCGQCGAGLTEECPVCRYDHPVGTKFCQANGKDLVAWVREESAWKVLVQTMDATLTVRPAITGILTILAILPALYYVGGFLFRQTMLEWRYEPSVTGLVLSSFFTIGITFMASMFCVAIPLSIIASIEKDRRRRLFREQRYTSLEPRDNIL